MREIKRTIVSAAIISADGKLLMGRKNPERGGVYPDCWHIPGGGVDEDETMEQTIRREILEEVGVDISADKVVLLPEKGSGISEKTLRTGEKVLCHMEFNYFRIDLDRRSADIGIKPGDDLVELRWFDKDEINDAKLVPGSKGLFRSINFGLTHSTETKLQSGQ